MSFQPKEGAIGLPQMSGSVRATSAGSPAADAVTPARRKPSVVNQRVWDKVMNINNTSVPDDTPSQQPVTTESTYRLPDGRTAAEGFRMDHNKLWIDFIDPATGRRFYLNRLTREVSYDEPAQNTTLEDTSNHAREQYFLEKNILPAAEHGIIDNPDDISSDQRQILDRVVRIMKSTTLNDTTQNVLEFERIVQRKDDRMLVVGLLGIVLTVIELFVVWDPVTRTVDGNTVAANVIKSLISFDTLILLFMLVDYYHFQLEVKQVKWKHVSKNNIFSESSLRFKMLLELVLCLLHVPPFMPYIDEKFGLVIFVRLYLAARSIRDHSMIWQNRNRILFGLGRSIHVDKFGWYLTLKTFFFENSIKFVTLLTVFVWVISVLFGNVFEREVQEDWTLGNTMWWGIVTMTTLGYGDYQPITLGGRMVASFAAVMGLILFSLSIAVLNGTLTLSDYQRYCVSWVQETKRREKERVLAARYIQHIWRYRVWMRRFSTRNLPAKFRDKGKSVSRQSMYLNENELEDEDAKFQSVHLMKSRKLIKELRKSRGYRTEDKIQMQKKMANDPYVQRMSSIEASMRTMDENVEARFRTLELRMEELLALMVLERTNTASTQHMPSSNRTATTTNTHSGANESTSSARSSSSALARKGSKSNLEHEQPPQQQETPQTRQQHGAGVGTQRDSDSDDGEEDYEEPLSDEEEDPAVKQ